MKTRAMIALIVGMLVIVQIARLSAADVTKGSTSKAAAVIPAILLVIVLYAAWRRRTSSPFRFRWPQIVLLIIAATLFVLALIFNHFAG